MHDHTSIEEWIAGVLAHSGLPLSQRVETAEEWHAHLDQLINDNESAGMTREQAVRAALSAFGQPELLRRQLRREQRALDRRAAIAEARKVAWLIALAPALVVVLELVVLEPVSIWWGLIASLPSMLCLCMFMAIAAYFAALTETRLTRRRPRTELGCIRRFALWSFVAVTGLAAMLMIPLLFLVSAIPLLASKPWFQQVGPSGFFGVFAGAFLDRAEFNIPVTLVTVFVAALAATLYERSRCVDEPVSTSLCPKAGQVQSAP